MRIFILVFISLIICIPKNGLAVVDCATTNCAPGKYCDTNQGCKGCEPGYYCIGGTNAERQLCTKVGDGSYDHSDGERKSEQDCYKTCDKEEDLDGRGTRHITNCRQYPNSLSQDVTVTCNKTDLQCSGYHPNESGTDCVSNYQENCTVPAWGSGIKLYDLTTYELGNTCYPIIKRGDNTATAGNQTLSNLIHCDKDSDIYYNPDGPLVTSIKCGTFLENCTVSAGNSASIEGTWIWDITTNPNSPSKDFSACTCNKSETRDNGKYTTECPYLSGSGDSTTWKTGSDCNLNGLECDNGYCDKNEAGQCIPTPAGFYANKTEDKRRCKSCPIGSTSIGGTTANEKKACYINKDTQFCDSTDNCFTLPLGTTKINYAGS